MCDILGQEQEDGAQELGEESRRAVVSASRPGRRPERLLERISHQTTTTAQLRQNYAAGSQRLNTDYALRRHVALSHPRHGTLRRIVLVTRKLQ